MNKIGNIIKELLETNGGKGLTVTLKGAPSEFWLSPDGKGIETEKLPHYVMKWEHFDAIIKKANEIGGKMYRGDVAARSGGKLGSDVPYDCMEGFVAGELLGTSNGKAVTRRSTYYSGILAWAGIVTIHKSEGMGSFITVAPNYRDIK